MSKVILFILLFAIITLSAMEKDTSMQKEQQKQLPYLPPEIWVNIIKQMFINITDLPGLNNALRDLYMLGAVNTYYYAVVKRHAYQVIENKLKSLLKFDDLINNYGLTPLHIVVILRHVNIVKYLVEHGVNINQQDIHGVTPLYYTLSGEAFISHIYNLRRYKQHNKNGQMPLSFTNCREDCSPSIGIMRYLIEHGANVNHEDKRGCTLLHKAVEYDHVEIVKYLVEHGAKINQENKFGDTPLHCAVRGDGIVGYISKDIVKCLVEHGAKVNRKNKNGDTPLHEAVEMDDDTIVKYLVKHGAKINKQNKNGYTPLDIASGYIADYLISHNSNANNSNNNSASYCICKWFSWLSGY